jgi:hypothetical protein
MVKLMNSAMMPEEGIYFLKKISKEMFVFAVKEAAKKNELESYIGYPQNITFLRQWAGLNIPLNRKETSIKHNDTLLIMRLKYRPESGAKGNFVKESDFEFFQAQYSALIDNLI